VGHRAIFGVKFQNTLKENPMTQGHLDLNGLLDAIKAGGDIDVLRSGAQMLYQALIEAELAERIGAGGMRESCVQHPEVRSSRTS
jgi:hypothetical protein